MCCGPGPPSPACCFRRSSSSPCAPRCHILKLRHRWRLGALHRLAPAPSSRTSIVALYADSSLQRAIEPARPSGQSGPSRACRLPAPPRATHAAGARDRRRPERLALTLCRTTRWWLPSPNCSACLPALPLCAAFAVGVAALERGSVRRPQPFAIPIAGKPPTMPEPRPDPSLAGRQRPRPAARRVQRHLQGDSPRPTSRCCARPCGSQALVRVAALYPRLPRDWPGAHGVFRAPSPAQAGRVRLDPRDRTALPGATLRAAPPAGDRACPRRRPHARCSPPSEAPAPQHLGLAGGTLARPSRELQPDRLVRSHVRHGTDRLHAAELPSPPAVPLIAARRDAARASSAGATLDDARTAVRMAFATR